MLSCVCCDCIGVQSVWDVIGSHHKLWTVVKLKWLQGSPTRSPNCCHLPPPPGDCQVILGRWMATCIIRVVMVVLGFSFNPCRWVWPVCGSWCRWLNKHTSCNHFTVSSSQVQPTANVCCVSPCYIFIQPTKCRWSVAAFPQRAVSPLWPVAAPLIAHQFNPEIAQSANNNCGRLHLQTQWDVMEQCWPI